MDYTDPENVRYVRDKALMALADFEHRSRRAVPAVLRSFYEGDFVNYHLRFALASLPRRGSAAFQLAITPPTWVNKNVPEALDIQRHMLPIFVTEQSLYVVADTRAPSSPVGWVMEGTGMDVVVPAGMELPSFLCGLSRTPPGRKFRCFAPASLDQYEEWDVEFDSAVI